MQPLPHHYSVTAAASATSNVSLAAPDAPRLEVAGPPQFDGPGDEWSPESLLVAAVASCFILTFRATARAAKLPWTQIECNAEGTLERVGTRMEFTRIVTRATLTVPEGASTIACERALAKAEENCLIANSLRCERDLQMQIVRTSIQEPQPLSTETALQA